MSRRQGATCACGAVDQRGEFCDACGLPIVTASRRVARRARRADRGPRRTAVVLVVVVALLAAGLGTATLLARQRTEDARRARAKLRADVQAVLPELVRFVETHRGLTFTAPVRVEVVDDAEFLARYAGERRSEVSLLRTGRRPRPPSARGPTLRALGIVDDAAEFDAGVEALTDVVGGFYAPETDELVVRGTDVTPLTRVVLVHELVHALQDQRLRLGELQRAEPGTDVAAAFDALVEGDARRIEQAYYRSLAPGDASAVPPEQVTGAVRGGRRAASAYFEFSYAWGPGFVRALVDARGRAGLDAAYADPPVSTEHVLHPERYLRGERPAEVAEPEPGGDVLDRGVLGELGLIVALGGDSGPVIREAADGWSGDRYVTYRAGERTCLRARVVMDSERDRLSLAGGFAARGADVTTEGPTTLLVESCR